MDDINQTLCSSDSKTLNTLQNGSPTQRLSRFHMCRPIRMDLQEVGCGHVDWIGLAQDRDRWRTLVSAVMNLRVP